MIFWISTHTQLMKKAWPVADTAGTLLSLRGPMKVAGTLRLACMFQVALAEMFIWYCDFSFSLCFGKRVTSHWRLIPNNMLWIFTVKLIYSACLQVMWCENWRVLMCARGTHAHPHLCVRSETAALICTIWWILWTERQLVALMNVSHY